MPHSRQKEKERDVNQTRKERKKTDSKTTEAKKEADGAFGFLERIVFLWVIRCDCSFIHQTQLTGEKSTECDREHKEDVESG